MEYTLDNNKFERFSKKKWIGRFFFDCNGHPQLKPVRRLNSAYTETVKNLRRTSVSLPERSEDGAKERSPNIATKTNTGNN